MFPLKLLEEPKEKGQEPVYPPASETCFIVAKNGIFKQVSNPFYTVRMRSQSVVAGLADAKESSQLKVDKLPFKLFCAVEAFFAKINTTLHGEAIVILAWNPVQRRWCVKVPAQRTRGLSVQYDLRKGKVIVAHLDTKNEIAWIAYDAEGKAPEFLDGYTDFGTIHSHCEIGAFHSGTDDADEVHFDGLHITIGNVHKTVKDYAARWILCGASFKVDDIGSVVTFPSAAQPNDLCVEQVKAREEERHDPHEYALEDHPHMRSLAREARQSFSPGNGKWNKRKGPFNPRDWDKLDEEAWRAARARADAERGFGASDDTRRPAENQLTEREIEMELARGAVWSPHGDKLVRSGEEGYLLGCLLHAPYHSRTDEELKLAEAVDESDDLFEILHSNEVYTEVLANPHIIDAYLDGDVNALAGITFDAEKAKGRQAPKPVKKEEAKAAIKTETKETVCSKESTK